MSKVSNLNKFRKKKAREDAAVQAAENRVRFGRSLEQRRKDEAQKDKAARLLDQHRRETPDD